ncbi:3,4-dihydroxy-2-butanone-4-phosphate synthase [Rhodococcus sp. NPDC127530]|uniref:3,4-dihydroxy-2-butanone-4-phosphate synthase n=1 Tax=unclassified Rhodococcus (in: high G+C Gram-positive bacteria) TaxID=192944 RepID=UPI00362A397E
MTVTAPERDIDDTRLAWPDSLSGPEQQGYSGSDVTRHLAAGRPVVVSRPHRHGFVVVAAHDASTTAAAFVIRHSSGFVQIALPRRRCEELLLPPMNPFDTGGARMCVGVDAVRGTGTGISAADRATTARALVDPVTGPGDLTRPGHLVPVCVDHRDTDMRDSAAAIALDLTRRTGLPPGALFADLVGMADPTRMMNHTECVVFSGTHNLPLVTVH